MKKAKGKKSKGPPMRPALDIEDGEDTIQMMKSKSLPNKPFKSLQVVPGMSNMGGSMKGMLEKASANVEKLGEEYKGKSSPSSSAPPSAKRDVIGKDKMIQLFDKEEIQNYFPLDKIQAIMGLVKAGKPVTLDFSGIEQVNDAVFATLLINRNTATYACVKGINLTACWHLTDQGVAWMAVCFPELLEVNLSGCVKITESGLHVLVSKCKKITDLDLTATNVAVLGVGCADKTVVTRGCPLLSPDKKTMATTNLSTILKAPGFMKSADTDMVKVVVCRPVNTTYSFLGYLTKDKDLKSTSCRSHSGHNLSPTVTANLVECDMAVMDQFISKRTLCVLPYGADGNMSVDDIATRLCTVVSHALSTDTGIPFIIVGMSMAGKKCVSPDAVKSAMVKLLTGTMESLRTAAEVFKKPQLKDYGWREQLQLARCVSLLSALDHMVVTMLSVDLQDEAGPRNELNAGLLVGAKQASDASPEYKEIYLPIFSYITSDDITTMLKDGVVSTRTSAKSNQRMLDILELFGRAKCLELSNQDKAVTSPHWMAQLISTGLDSSHGNNTGTISTVSTGVSIFIREEIEKTLTKVLGDVEQGKNGMTLYSELGMSCSLTSSASVMFHHLTDTVPPAIELIRKTDRKDFIHAEYTYEFAHPVSNIVLHRTVNLMSQLRKPLFLWQTGCVQQEGLLEIILDIKHQGGKSKLRLKGQTPQETSGFTGDGTSDKKDATKGKKLTQDRANVRLWQLVEQYHLLVTAIITGMGLFTKVNKKSSHSKPDHVFGVVSDHRIPIPRAGQDEEKALLCERCGVHVGLCTLQTRIRRQVTTSFLSEIQLTIPAEITMLKDLVINGNRISFLDGKAGTTISFRNVLEPFEQNLWNVTFLDGDPTDFKVSMYLSTGESNADFYELCLKDQVMAAYNMNGTKKDLTDLKFPAVTTGDTLTIQLSPGPLLEGKPQYSLSILVQGQLVATMSIPATKVRMGLSCRHQVPSQTCTVMVHGLLPMPSKSTEVQQGMRLEALDRQNPSLVCAATVAQIDSTDGRLLIHFDGWTKRYDYWTEPESQDLHPLGYMALNANSPNHHYTPELQKPKGRDKDFDWYDYLQEINALPVPYEFFNEAQCEGTQPDEENAVMEKLGYSNNTGAQEVMSCVSAKHTVRHLEFATMKKCTLTPAVVEFFNNNFKFFCLLPSALSVDTLLYPTLQQIINEKDQKIHLLCPGNRMELLHFADHCGIDFSKFIKQNQFSKIVSYLCNCYIGLILQKDILPNPPGNVLSGIKGSFDADMLDLMETRMRRLFYVYLLWCSQVDLVNKDHGLSGDNHMSVLTNIQGDKSTCNDLGKVFDLSYGFKTTGINSCLAHNLALSAGQDMKTINLDRFQMMYQFMQRLDFRKNGLKELSANFFEKFSKLEELDLSENQLRVVPGGFKKTLWLSVLNISKNNISSLPDDFVSLAESLTFLDISHNPLKELPAVVWKLVSLKSLHADNIGKIVNMESITNLKELTELSLASNMIEAIPEACRNLALTYLNLSGVPWFPDLVTGKSRPTFQKFKDILNQYTVFGAMLNEKEKLDLFSKVDKDASGTLEKEEIIEMNTLLFKMYPRFGVNKLSNTATGGVPDVILKITTLERLELSFHGLKQVPDEIGKLTSLTSLDVSNNPYLESLSSSLGELPMKELNLKYCPTLKTPPKEVVARGFNAVFGYLKRLLSGSVQCRRTKLMLVGLGGAGKTSLVRSLTSARYKAYHDYGEQITDGIDITDWNIPTGNKDESLTFNVWDFAGQTVYYNTHQFFLSNRAVYLLLWNIRLGFEHAGLEFWLNSVVCHAPKAPIIIVGTHCDKVEKSKIPQEELKRKYSQISGFFFVSSYSGEGITQLKDFLVKLTLEQKYMGERIPEAWLSLEKRVILKREQEAVDLVKWKFVEDIASECGILDGQELVQAVQFLHDLGSLQFFNTEFLRGYVVIYPQWIVNVMACIVTVHAGPTEEGKLYHKDMSEIWKDYPTEFHPWLLRLTEEFDLTFPLMDEEANLVPCLLANQEQKYVWPTIEARSDIKEGKMVYNFEYLPGGLFNRAQVRLHQFAEKGVLWKKGMFLKKNNHIAVMLQDDAGSVLVKAQGFRPENMIFLVHEVFETLIADAYGGVQYDYQIPCMECLNMHLSEPSMFSASKIQRATEMKAPFLQCDNLFHVLSITELQNSMPPDRNVDLDNHLRRSVQELHDLGEGVNVNVLFCFSKRNIPSLQDEGKCVHPGHVMEDLRKTGFSVSFCDNPETADMSSLTLTMKSAKVVLIGMSDEYCESEACRNIVVFVKETLRKPIVLVCLGKSLKWKESNLFMTVSSEVYVKLIDPTHYKSKMAELVEAIQRKVSKKTVVESFPCCFVSYSWSNSHDAIAKGSREKQGALGWADPRKVKNFLEEKGIPCWLDIERVGGGGLFEDIADGLRKAQVVVACVSDEYANSANCGMEFRFALCQLRLPVILAVVGTGYQWERSEIGMLSVGHQCIKLNFQNQNQGAFEDLLNEVKTRIKVVEEKDENKKGEDQQKVAFQEVLELSQRQFLRHLVGYADAMYSGHYPRLIVLDLVEEEAPVQEEKKLEKPKTDEERKAAEAADRDKHSKKLEHALKNMRRKESELADFKSQDQKGIGAEDIKKAINQIQDEADDDDENEEEDENPKWKSKYCYRLLCEHEEGWHMVNSMIPSPQHADKEEEEQWLTSMAPYMARMFAILKYSGINMASLNTPDGQTLQAKLQTVATGLNKTEFQEEYVEARANVMDIDQAKTAGGLKRCHMLSGKILWLCDQHRLQGGSKTEKMYQQLLMPQDDPGKATLGQQEPEQAPTQSSNKQPKETSKPKLFRMRETGGSKSGKLKRQTSQACSVM